MRSGTLDYGAIVLDYADIGNNIFVKIQDQGPGSEFTNGAFYKRGGSGREVPPLPGTSWAGSAWARAREPIEGNRPQQRAKFWGKQRGLRELSRR